MPAIAKLTDFLDEVYRSTRNDRAVFRPIPNYHHVHGDLESKVEQLLDLILTRPEAIDRTEVRRKLVQIAATAARAVHDLDL